MISNANALKIQKTLKNGEMLAAVETTKKNFGSERYARQQKNFLIAKREKYMNKVLLISLLVSKLPKNTKAFMSISEACPCLPYARQ